MRLGVFLMTSIVAESSAIAHAELRYAAHAISLAITRCWDAMPAPLAIKSNGRREVTALTPIICAMCARIDGFSGPSP
jgi:hypothetical protein